MKTLCLFFLMLVASSFTFPAKDAKLEYKFKVGDQYDWTQTTTQAIKQSIPGMGEMTIDVKMEGAMAIKVVELTPTGAKIEIQYTKLKMDTKSSMGMGDANMDSESTEDNPQVKIIKSLMNKPFFFYLSKLGNVEKVEGTDNLYSGLGTLGLDQATIDGTKQSFQQLLSEKSLRNSFEMALIRYPETKVKGGDTWKSVGGLSMNFPVEVQSVWTLKSLEASAAKIGGEGTMITTDKEKAVSLPNGMKSKFDLGGKQLVSGTVDITSGFPSEMKVLSEIKGSMTLLAGGMIPEDMLVPMEIVSEGTYTMVKKK